MNKTNTEAALASCVFMISNTGTQKYNSILQTMVKIYNPIPPNQTLVAILEEDFEFRVIYHHTKVKNK